MTENADVRWLRETFGGYIPPEFNAFATREVYFMQMRRLLAHIDQLEAEVKMLREVEAECGRQLDRRPTIHEIAAQIAAGQNANPVCFGSPVEFAKSAYDSAEALIAEGRRRDGL